MILKSNKIFVKTTKNIFGNIRCRILLVLMSLIVPKLNLFSIENYKN